MSYTNLTVPMNDTESALHLAFVVGEWFAKTLRHLDREAFDSRELGRAMLALCPEALSLPMSFTNKLAAIREAAVQACIASGGIGIGGPEMIDRVRLTICSEIVEQVPAPIVKEVESTNS